MGTALGAVPFPLLQAKTRNFIATETTGLCGCFPAADLNHADALSTGDVLQDGYKLSKAQVGNLAAPQTLHAIQIEVFDTDDGEFVSQPVCQLEEPVAPAVAHLFIHSIQVSADAFPVVAAFLASGELPVCGTKLRQRRLIPLWGFNDPSIRSSDSAALYHCGDSMIRPSSSVRKCLSPKSMPTALPARAEISGSSWRVTMNTKYSPSLVRLTVTVQILPVTSLDLW